MGNLCSNYEEGLISETKRIVHGKETFIILKELGSGAFASVYLCTDKSGQKYAVKKTN